MLTRTASIASLALLLTFVFPPTFAPKLAAQSEKPTLMPGPIILRSPKALISLIN